MSLVAAVQLAALLLLVLLSYTTVIQLADTNTEQLNTVRHGQMLFY